MGLSIIYMGEFIAVQDLKMECSLPKKEVCLARSAQSQQYRKYNVLCGALPQPKHAFFDNFLTISVYDPLKHGSKFQNRDFNFTRMLCAIFL